MAKSMYSEHIKPFLNSVARNNTVEEAALPSNTNTHKHVPYHALLAVHKLILKGIISHTRMDIRFERAPYWLFSTV